MTGLVLSIVAVLMIGILAYHRASLIIWTICFALLLGLMTNFIGVTVGLVITWSLFLIVAAALNIFPLRRRLISARLFSFYKRVRPKMSLTEREAISAGTVSWEGDLFRGNPDWQKLLAFPKAQLSAEEQAFLDGPVDTLCRMLDDWDIIHNLSDMPPHVWKYIKEQGFFGLIIPKAYGGKEFSAYAHSQVIIKLSGRSITASSTVAVPNSLGPAELLLHYGTDEQKNYYLPRLARGEEIPCFALTSPEAGSDATAMTDNGVVCWGEYQGKQVLGIRLNWSKRYITLAPVATVIGLAFKMYDPNHLLGNKEDIGITCALIPRNTPGVTIGRRHYPIHTPFQNGPIQGKDVFIPVDFIIGGAKQAGKGWRMLMESLAVGRCISLPASTTGGAKVVSYAAGAYARIRKQFNISIGRFEGIEAPLARIAANTYMMDAARTFGAATVDRGEKPSVASAIIKCHVTEMGRKVAWDGTDIHGGKAICLGPKNYIGRGYVSAPIAITVEGANILTRNMIIFGQGAIRCHPYVLPELEAARIQDPTLALKTFDKVVFGHIGFALGNIVRSFVLGITTRFVTAPNNKAKRYFQHATRFSSALALITDVSLLSLGSNLKRKESISARLGDILSYLYLMSAVLKQYHDQGEPAEDFPIVQFACEYCLYKIQTSFDETMRNFPNRAFAMVLRGLIFPLGQHFSKPKDSLNHQIAQLLMAPTETRQRLATGAFISAVKENVLADVQDALVKTIAAEPIEKIIKTAYEDDLITGLTMSEQAQSALEKKIISVEEFDIYMQADAARRKIIAVDDFSAEELTHQKKEVTAYINLYADSNGTHG